MTGAKPTSNRIDLATGTTSDGDRFKDINHRGFVPAQRPNDGPYPQLSLNLNDAVGAWRVCPMPTNRSYKFMISRHPRPYDHPSYGEEGWGLSHCLECKMQQYPIYKNPYENFKADSSTVLKLHLVGSGESEISSFVSSLSPYVAKLEAYFRLFKIAHEIVAEPVPDVGPRGKVPFISVGDTRLADSQLIIDYLKKTQGDPDANLTPAQKALGHLVQRTLEDHLYWIIIYYEFFDQNGWDFLMKELVGDPSALPPEIQVALAERRADFRKRCYDQGIARYTPDEIVAKASKDFDAISQILGDNRYLLGTDQPTSFDAVLFGFTVAFFQARGMHPEITDHARSIPNLGQYFQRMLAIYYPELKPTFQPA